MMSMGRTGAEAKNSGGRDLKVARVVGEAAHLRFLNKMRDRSIETKESKLFNGVEAVCRRATVDPDRPPRRRSQFDSSFGHTTLDFGNVTAGFRPPRPPVIARSLSGEGRERSK
eukprot:Selendium_serpulae@DN6270_c0_g1_i3.p3